ncbi:hypothetical protein CCACVL1_27387 [Corchorus capsularis]|uniref:Uncharacterized protein n=1 Tax=Corchorus capsularis TaxID=210143 RepID=A0A1R3GAK4_COCAP|nr:hypothetical protein CCACVL1_27387 [Corchorus capsularis]
MAGLGLGLSFLNLPKLRPFSSHGRSKISARPEQEQEQEVNQEMSSSALKIVHAGGVVECYYMAMPAASIMKKYPSLILARPQVFRRPWDSLVRSREILTPGEKIYLVPPRTIKKLRKRITKPGQVAGSSIDVSKDGLTSKSFLQPKEVSDSSEKST